MTRPLAPIGFAALLLACSGDREQHTAASPGSTLVNLPAGAVPPSPPPEPMAAPVGRVYTIDPTAVATLLAAAAAAPPARTGPARGNDDDAGAIAALRAAGAEYAPGMTPVGETARATLFEGGHASFVATLDNSKCYAIVAAGAGITELDMHVLLPPYNNLLAGQDGMTGPAAAVGAAPNVICPTLVTPFDYKVDLQATKGGGTVAAQLYAKQK